MRPTSKRPRPARDAEHGIVYRNDAEFAAWPFVSGFWETADGDYVAAFRKKPAAYARPSDVHHDDFAKAGPELVAIRSSDRGETCDEASLQVLFDFGRPHEDMFGDGAHDYAGEPPLDFADPNVLVASGSTPDYYRPDSRAWVRASTDGGRNWRRPILLPLVGLASLSGHASALVRADGTSLILLTAVSADGWQRRPVVYGSVDGGRFWTFIAFMTPVADDGAAVHDQSLGLRFSPHRYFYPRGIALPDGRLLASMRGQRDPTGVLWTEIFESFDEGRTWRFVSRVNDWGAPGDIVRMRDGRIVCVYGYRHPPYGIRARVSEDGGRTWLPELVIRDDGGSWDLGYPRAVEREDGRILTVYYMNLKSDPIQMQGGVRHIAQSLFTPD